MQICFLCGCHTCMAQSPCNAGYGNPGKQQQGCVSVPQPMNSNNWQVRPPAMSGQNVIDSGVVNPLFRHKDRLLRGKLAHKGRKLNHCLPVGVHVSVVFRKHRRAAVGTGACCILFHLSPELDMLLLGDRSAELAGIRMKRLKPLLMLAVTALSASVVSCSGCDRICGTGGSAYGPDALRRHVPQTSAGKHSCWRIAPAPRRSARTVAAPQEIPVGILTSLAARLRRCTGYADPAFWMNQPVRTTSGFSMHSTVFSTALRARESASS